MTDPTPLCTLCGEPMPPGEEMFKFHGYSGPCPKPPKPRSVAERLSDYLGLRPDQSREILRHRCGCESEDDHQTGNPDCAVGLLVEAILEKAGKGRAGPCSPSPKCCGAPAPDRSTRSCDLPQGHVGDHWTYAGRTLKWPQAGTQGVT